MTTSVNPIPEGFHSVTPALSLKDSREAIEFYKKAFNAEVLDLMPGPDGKSTMHATIKIGNSILMMGDENPEQGCQSAESLGASPVSLCIYVPNVDEAFQQAIAAGGTETMPVMDMFWGDRCGSLTDPFGYKWWIGTHTRNLSQKEIQEGALAFYQSAGKP